MKTTMSIFLMLFASISYSQVLDPTWKKSVALIEIKEDTSYRPVGTGILVVY